MSISKNREEKKIQKEAFVLRKKQYAFMTAVRGRSIMHIRLRNTEGDIDFQRSHFLELVCDATVESTKVEHIELTQTDLVDKKWTLS